MVSGMGLALPGPKHRPAVWCRQGPTLPGFKLLQS